MSIGKKIFGSCRECMHHELQEEYRRDMHVEDEVMIGCIVFLIILIAIIYFNI